MNDVSEGVAQTLILEYFQKIVDGDARSEIISYYGHDAVLVWEDNEICGIENISTFFENLSKTITFSISGYEVQPVQIDTLPTDWTMLIVFGSYRNPSGKMFDFHSSFMVE